MKAYELNRLGLHLFVLLALSAPGAWADQPPNTLTDEEKAQGWALLFDGETPRGWRGSNRQTFPEGGWVIEGGTLRTVAGRGGDILTLRQYGDFDLRAEFLVKEQRVNSGIKYFVSETEYRKGEALGIEYQIHNASPGEHLKNGLGSAYDILPPNWSEVHPSESGTWNTARIVSRGKRIQHWLNGKLILEYERGSDSFREAVSQSKFRNIPGFGELAEGHILLQHHGDEVTFRNLKIRELAP